MKHDMNDAIILTLCRNLIEIATAQDFNLKTRDIILLY